MLARYRETHWFLEGGAAYALATCLSHLSNDHASRSRRCTVPTPNGDTSNFWAFTTIFHLLHRNVLLILSSSRFAFCGHLSPRIAIVFSVLSTCTNFLNVTNRLLSSFPPLTHPVPPCTFHTLPQRGFYPLLLCHNCIPVHLILPPPDYVLIYLFLPSGRSRSATRNHSFSDFT